MLLDKILVELGAGAGLCGVVASQLRTKSVILTDRDPDSLDLLRRNADANKAGDVHVARLPWGDEECVAALPTSRGAVDIVLGSDVLYPSIPQAVVDLLFETARSLLRPEGAGRLVLSFIARDGKQTLRAMLRSAKKAGFQLDEMIEAECVRSSRPESTSLGARIFIYSSPPADGSLSEEHAMAFDRTVDSSLPAVWEDPPPGSSDSEEEWEAPFAEEDEEQD
jgi:precorrin-6B methylase 2